MDGTWDTSLEIGCYIAAVCPESRYHNANWPAAVPGESSVGNCSLGYRFAYTGPPERQCFTNGMWDSEVTNRCSRRDVPSTAGV